MTINEIIQRFNGEINCYEDFNLISEDKNYIVYTEVTSSPHVYQEGKTFIRAKNYDLDLFCTLQERNNLISLVESKLSDINYTKINVGWNNDLQRYQITFNFNL